MRGGAISATAGRGSGPCFTAGAAVGKRKTGGEEGGATAGGFGRLFTGGGSSLRDHGEAQESPVDFHHEGFLSDEPGSGCCADIGSSHYAQAFTLGNAKSEQLPLACSRWRKVHLP